MLRPSVDTAEKDYIHAGLLPGMLGILTDVQERDISGIAKAPAPPTGGVAFPKATHRKLSRVCEAKP